MLSDLNRSLADNHCNVEHVIVVDGNGIESLPADLAANATVIASARPIGQAAARNLGLLVARGEWITSADDDDWLYPRSIDQAWLRLMTRPGPCGQPAIAPTTSRTIRPSLLQDHAWQVMSGVHGHLPMTAFPWVQPPCLWRLPCSSGSAAGWAYLKVKTWA